MDEEKKIVAEMIESGTYYDEALSWYNSIHVRPRTQIAQLIILLLLSLTFLGIAGIAFFKIFPIDKEVGFVIERPYSPEEDISIKELSKHGGAATEGVVKYYLTEYIKSREEYNDERLDRNFRFVTDLSDDKVFEQFLTESDMRQNPNHPVLLYGKNARKKIFIDKVNLIDLPKEGTQIDTNKEYRAIINYSVSLIFIDNTQQITSHQADISFKYKEIIVDQNTHEIKQLPELIITDYKTKEI
ncbi:MAG: hypothetical protein COV36_06130 [Alphaproteobacteria bacterium CG11_big_fil_rev_8_21_14_0_20_44_7]|nr:MAG: hypothetical protein COV36_06130 [Alphaproteobacteria bacterium CG11_big_fil_rev_8_21_14_0_20_44_7]